MPTNTTEQVELSLVLDSQEYQCQVINLSLTLAGTSTGDTVEVACPDGVVVEPGDHEDGSLSGEVFADTTDQGITWVLMQAMSAAATMDYTLTWFSNETADVAFTVTGQAQVGTFQMDWSKPGYGRHPIDLTLLSTDLGRPA